MTALYGMMAMMPLLFAGAGYFLVSSAGCRENRTTLADGTGTADTNP
ncbi:hypothetical protein [Mycolicibacterium sp. GF69]|nr:hypothetical protein [Mycolicibacterium sp. GF69]